MTITANWTRENLAWAGGLFEGEGCIYTTGRVCQAKIAMTDEDVIRKFHGIIGLGGVNGPYLDKRRAHFKPVWVWSVAGSRHVQAVIAALWAFLGDRRRKKAGDVLAVASSIRPYGIERKRCAKGHEFTESNTYWSGPGRRICKQCKLDDQRVRYWKNKNNKGVEWQSQPTTS